VAYWRERLGELGAGLKVGFSWRSSNLSGVRALRCTHIDQWAPVFAVKGVHFVSLQYDDCAEELARGRAQSGVALHAYPEVDLFNDLAEAAALTAAVDLVISAPTSVSDLAAALGVETWQMTYGANWKTFGSRRDPWHPSITRIERPAGQPWEGVLEAIADMLRERASE
jgi:hypothetical protein